MNMFGISFHFLQMKLQEKANLTLPLTLYFVRGFANSFHKSYSTYVQHMYDNSNY